MRTQPGLLFSVGLLVQLVVVAGLYWLLPKVNLLGEGWSVYPPGNYLPEELESSARFTNINLLIKLSFYPICYSLAAAILYLLAAKWIILEHRLGTLHFFLAMLGFALIIPFNVDIILPHLGADSFYLSDVYVGGSITPTFMMEAQKQIMIYKATSSPASIIGIAALVSGVVVFLVNVFRNFRKK